MENKVVTINDVAEKAGVSISTVSRALNNYSDINEKTRQRVVNIAEQLGYKPSPIARSLGASKYFRLGILVEDYDLDRSNQFVFEVLMSFKNSVTKHGYEMILLTTTSDMQKSKNLAQLFQEKQIDGAFIMGLKMTDEYYKQLSTLKYPCVLFDYDVSNPCVSGIGVNNLKGAFLAVEHLIAQNHGRIGFINGSKEALVSFERLDGYYLALNRYGIPVDQSLIMNADFSHEGAERAAKELIQRNPDLTAIFCASDIMAIGAMNMLEAMGINVPDDISVVGFDDIYLAQLVKPKLTTVRQDREKIGEIAANILVNLLSEQRMGRVMLEPELIVRESTRKLEIGE